MAAVPDELLRSLSLSASAANVLANGRRFRFAEKALHLIPLDNRFRRWCINLVTWRWFDRFVLLLIFGNAVTLALSDYGVLDPDTLAPASSGISSTYPHQPARSLRNEIGDSLEPVFTVLFTAESLLKMVAMGVIASPGCYLRDAWNWIDFLVVITSLLGVLPGFPSVSVLRTFRVLRPLRSLTAMPKMKILVVSLLASLPALANVLLLMGFVFTLFGITGLQIWSGMQHFRCRLTDGPIAMPAANLGWFMALEDFAAAGNTSAQAELMSIAGDRAAYPYCTDATGNRIPLNDASWQQDTSPWTTARACVWPVDFSDPRYCSADGSGMHRCSATTTCGSNYDAFGNARFQNKAYLYAATYVEDLAWGYTKFDWIFDSVLTIFQSVTMEGWVFIMYQLQDVTTPLLAIIYFVLLILIGTFFLLNLTLAVIWDSFEKNQSKEAANARAAAVLAEYERLRVAARLDDVLAAHGASRVADGDTAARASPTQVDDAGEGNDSEGTEGSGDEEAEKGRRAPGPPVHASSGIRRLGSSESVLRQSTSAALRHARAAVTGRLWRAYSAVARLQCSERASAAALRIVATPVFEGFIVACILLNTAAMASDQYPVDEELAFDMEVINFTLSMIFTVEMVLKIAALGLPRYAKEGFNLFDAFIVAVSFLELALTPPRFIRASDGRSGGALSALRTFRLFRLFKLARSWKSLQRLLATMVATLADVANFSVLLLLFMYIEALLGMQFFSNRMRFDPTTERVVEFNSPAYATAEVPRHNFDTFLSAFVTIFQVLSAEDWHQVFYDGWRASGWMASVYFVSLVVVGQFIILNLFLAILLGNFEGIGDEEESASGKGNVGPRPSVRLRAGMLTFVAQSRASATRMWCRWRDRLCCSAQVAPAGEAAPAAQAGGHEADEEAPAPLPPAAEPASGAGQPPRDEELAEWEAERTRAVPHLGAPGGAGRPADLEKQGSDVASIGATSEWARRLQSRWQGHVHGVSLFLMPPHHPVRLACYHVIKRPWFDNVILVLIMVSSTALAVDSPLLDPQSGLAAGLTILDMVMTSLFTVEMILKIASLGFALHRGSYLRDSWNILDFVIVVVSWLSLFSSSPSLSSLRSLRTLRALRPLRVIARNEGMKLVVNALFRSVPSILNVLLVSMLFFLIFAVIGQNYFKGAFAHCTGDAWEALSTAQQALVVDPVPFAALTAAQRGWAAVAGAGYTGATSKAVCTWLGAEWELVVPQTFNNLYESMSTLFQMSTTEGWVNIMYAGVDARGVDMQPVRDASPGWVFFFMFFIVVGSFFVMNLFVGVVIDNFNQMRDELGGLSLLTEEQRKWMSTQEMLMRVRPAPKTRRPHGAARAACFDVVTLPRFDHFIMACILANALVLATQSFGQSRAMTDALEALNYAFAVIFTVEAVLKLAGLGVATYFRDRWNVFDFIIVVGTALGLILKWTTGSSVGSVAMVIRTFRVGRLFRLIRSARGLRTLFQTLIITIPALSNVASLLFLLFFIYAIMGVQLFATAKYGEAHNEQANFRSFGVALVTLWRCGTGEAWNEIMYDLVNTQDCDPNPVYNATVCGFSDHDGCVPLDGCGSPAAFPFFMTFTLLITFIMLNLFIGVILDGFGDLSNKEGARLTEDDFATFTRFWSAYDPDADYFITVTDLEAMMRALPRPMGLGEEAASAPAEKLRMVLAMLHLPTYARGGQPHVYYPDVARALARRCMEAALETTSVDLPESHAVSRRWTKMHTRRCSAQVNMHTLGQIYAATTIHTVWQTWKFMRTINAPGGGRGQTTALGAAASPEMPGGPAHEGPAHRGPDVSEASRATSNMSEVHERRDPLDPQSLTEFYPSSARLSTQEEEDDSAETDVEREVTRNDGAAQAALSEDAGSGGPLVGQRPATEAQGGGSRLLRPSGVSPQASQGSEPGEEAAQGKDGGEGVRGSEDEGKGEAASSGRSPPPSHGSGKDLTGMEAAAPPTVLVPPG